MKPSKAMANAKPWISEVAGQKPRFFIRLNPSEIRQHAIFAVCFIILAITGFMTKLPESMVEALGEAGEIVFLCRSILHRFAGTTMILVSVYHLYYLAMKPGGKRWLADMKPTFRDIRDMICNMLFCLGIKSPAPEFDRFCYKQKIEYGALIVGTTLMSVSGLLLWTEHRWSKFIVDIAGLVHGMEAILACLAIMVWHLYEVQFKPGRSPLANTWKTGLIDEHEMKEEYPRHYRKIMDDSDLREIYIKREESPVKIVRVVSASELPRIH